MEATPTGRLGQSARPPVGEGCKPGQGSAPIPPLCGMERIANISDRTRKARSATFRNAVSLLGIYLSFLSLPWSWLLILSTAPSLSSPWALMWPIKCTISFHHILPILDIPISHPFPFEMSQYRRVKPRPNVMIVDESLNSHQLSSTIKHSHSHAIKRLWVWRSNTVKIQSVILQCGLSTFTHNTVEDIRLNH